MVTTKKANTRDSKDNPGGGRGAGAVRPGAGLGLGLGMAEIFENERDYHCTSLKFDPPALNAGRGPPQDEGDAERILRPLQQRAPPVLSSRCARAP